MREWIGGVERVRDRDPKGQDPSSGAWGAKRVEPDPRRGARPTIDAQDAADTAEAVPV